MINNTAVSIRVLILALKTIQLLQLFHYLGSVYRKNKSYES